MAIKVKAKERAKKAPADRAVTRAPRTRAGRTSTSRISSKNQITIPVEVLRASGLMPGDLVTIKYEREKMSIEKIVDSGESTPWQAWIGASTDLLKDFDWEKERRDAWGE